jgi:hypothetical protein
MRVIHENNQVFFLVKIDRISDKLKTKGVLKKFDELKIVQAIDIKTVQGTPAQKGTYFNLKKYSEFLKVFPDDGLKGLCHKLHEHMLLPAPVIIQEPSKQEQVIV